MIGSPEKVHGRGTGQPRQVGPGAIPSQAGLMRAGLNTAPARVPAKSADHVDSRVTPSGVTNPIPVMTTVSSTDGGLTTRLPESVAIAGAADHKQGQPAHRHGDDPFKGQAATRHNNARTAARRRHRRRQRRRDRRGLGQQFTGTDADQNACEQADPERGGTKESDQCGHVPGFPHDVETGSRAERSARIAYPLPWSLASVLRPPDGESPSRRSPRTHRGIAATPVICRTPDSDHSAVRCRRRVAPRPPRLLEQRDGPSIKSARICAICVQTLHSGRDSPKEGLVRRFHRFAQISEP